MCKKKNVEWKLILKLPCEFAILHNPNSPEPYNCASGYNEQDNTWAWGNYCKSIDDALAIYLYLQNHRWIKSRYQRECEETSRIAYGRLVELATQFKDGLLEDDEEQALIYFSDICEMDKKEIEFFGIEVEESEEE